ncbi:hypothetical protein DPEC_G00333660 [Dallia pectoralis]|uniref:Uncharacterized protein n=1 Tax=Dallia pectoralis TaxID=75939 RepID=A0ACC2F6G9_DALPE|nr:hypothetical protein DPEC_G00333660 [Dallia pectoralis]
MSGVLAELCPFSDRDNKQDQLSLLSPVAAEGKQFPLVQSLPDSHGRREEPKRKSGGNLSGIRNQLNTKAAGMDAGGQEEREGRAAEEIRGAAVSTLHMALRSRYRPVNQRPVHTKPPRRSVCRNTRERKCISTHRCQPRTRPGIHGKTDLLGRSGRYSGNVLNGSTRENKTINIFAKPVPPSPVHQAAPTDNIN